MSIPVNWYTPGFNVMEHQLLTKLYYELNSLTFATNYPLKPDWTAVAFRDRLPARQHLELFLPVRHQPVRLLLHTRYHRLSRRQRQRQEPKRRIRKTTRYRSWSSCVRLHCYKYISLISWRPGKSRIYSPRINYIKYFQSLASVVNIYITYYLQSNLITLQVVGCK